MLCVQVCDGSTTSCAPIHLLLWTSTIALISWRIWRIEIEAKLVSDFTAKENGNRKSEPGMRIGMVINVIVESGEYFHGKHAQHCA